MKTLRMSLIILVLFLTLFLPVATVYPGEVPSKSLLSADGPVLEMEDIVIRKVKDKINFRVRIKNVGTETAENLKDNLVIYLRVKDPGTKQWRELQQWANIDSIKPDETVARDRIPVKETDPAVLSEKFTLSAEIKLKHKGNIKISKSHIERRYPEDAVKNP